MHVFPQEDNGYKVYWDNGAQINSPHDKEIARRITENSEPWPDAWNADLYHGHPRCHDPMATVLERYMAEIMVYSHLPHSAPHNIAPLTYTAMHGLSAALMCMRPYGPKAWDTSSLPSRAKSTALAPSSPCSSRYGFGPAHVLTNSWAYRCSLTLSSPLSSTPILKRCSSAYFAIICLIYCRARVRSSYPWPLQTPMGHAISLLTTPMPTA